MSRDYDAKRLAKAEGISYTEALRRVRAARAAQASKEDDVPQTADSAG